MEIGNRERSGRKGRKKQGKWFSPVQNANISKKGSWMSVFHDKMSD